MKEFGKKGGRGVCGKGSAKGRRGLSFKDHYGAPSDAGGGQTLPRKPVSGGSWALWVLVPR